MREREREDKIIISIPLSLWPLRKLVQAERTCRVESSAAHSPENTTCDSGRRDPCHESDATSAPVINNKYRLDTVLEVSM